MLGIKGLCVATLLLQTKAHEREKPGSLRPGADKNADKHADKDADKTSGSQPVGDIHIGVKTKRWAPTSDSGGCSLPGLPGGLQYTTPYALAIGGNPNLGDLNADRAHNLCGLVLRVQCYNNATIDAVIASTCDIGDRSADACGLDLVQNAWDAATDGVNPGTEYCKVQLTDSKPISGSAPICAHRPDSIAGSSESYSSVGMFNTGKPVKSATLNDAIGQFNGGASNYFDFNAIYPNTFKSDSLFTVTFEDGTTQTLKYGDCTKVSNAHIFGGSRNFLRMQEKQQEMQEVQ
ncbi:hypothetical protein ACHAWF_002039 [Thalassiosira exigua]